MSEQRYVEGSCLRHGVVRLATQTDFGYTGQRNLDAQQNVYSLGLMDYKARFYNPALMRFTQPDTITPGGPQGLNRYSYVSNNPINYNDPSGHKECEDEYGCNGPLTPLVHEPITPPEPEHPIVLPEPSEDDMPNICYCFPQAPPQRDSNIDSTSELNGWELARQFFGAIDPIELGPLSGSGLSILQGIKYAAEGYLLGCGSYCLQNPQIGKALGIFMPVAEGIAISYDYVYDQWTDTGPYSSLPPRSLPPWSSLTTGQKAWRVGYTILVVLIIIPVLPP